MDDGMERTAELVERMRTTAAAVAQEHGALLEATADEDAAEAALVEAAVEAVRPALAAMSSRLRVGWRRWWPDRISTDEEVTYDPRRGVCVAGDRAPSEDYPRANRGGYEGKGLVLLADGTFAVRTFGGGWSRWQGEGSEWTAEVRPVTAAEALKAGFDADDIVTGIAAALDKHTSGGRTKAAERSKERATKLRAVVSLLGAGRM